MIPTIKVGCYVMLLISFPLFCSSSQQPENGELWRPCENFPGKNQRAKNLNRMPRVSMRTSRESEYLGDCVINPYVLVVGGAGFYLITLECLHVFSYWRCTCLQDMEYVQGRILKFGACNRSYTQFNTFCFRTSDEV